MVKKNKLIFKKLKISNRFSYIIIVSIALILLGTGVYSAVGHAISEIAPPSGCVSGQFLKWTGSAWICETLGPYLINRFHTLAQCTSAGGTIIGLPEGNICKFHLSACPTDWAQYQQYSETEIMECSGSDCDSTPENNRYCRTGSHIWGNVFREECIYFTHQDPPASAFILIAVQLCDLKRVCTATIIDIGCY